MSMSQIITWVMCALIIGLHANERFNTPLRNRSTTRRRLYLRARTSYILVTGSVFLLIAYILFQWPLPGEDSKLISVLIAVLFLTDGIPHIPFLREIDHTILEFFKGLANIPEEVQHCAEQLKPERLRVLSDDLHSLTTFIENDGTLPTELQCHLRIDEGDQVEISEYRFTKALKLYKHLIDLASITKYERFFNDYEEEWKQAQRDFQNFCLRSVTSLELAVKYRAENAVAVHRDLMEDIRENFRSRCRERFSQLALLLAGALISSEPDEQDLVAALHQVGFEATYESTIDFPVDELSLLAVFLVVYVFVIYAVIGRLLTHFFGSLSTAPSSAPAIWPLLTVVSYIGAVTATIWWLFKHPSAASKASRPWGKYIVCAALSTLSAVFPFIILVIARYLSHGEIRWQLLFRMSLPTGAMCFVVAALCETNVRDNPDHAFRHLGEGLVVALTIAASELVLYGYMGPLFSETGLGPRTFAFTVAIPFTLAAIIGFFVPHMYRMHRDLAQSRNTAEGDFVEPRQLRVVRPRRAAAVAIDTITKRA
jgi:hypothetical protein